MLEATTQVPDECKKLDPEFQCAWFKCIIDRTNEVYGWVGVGLVHDHAALHLIFNRSMTGVYRQAKKDWDELKRLLKTYGVKKLVATNENIKDDRWPKLLKMFGFPKPRNIWISSKEV